MQCKCLQLYTRIHSRDIKICINLSWLIRNIENCILVSPLKKYLGCPVWLKKKNQHFGGLSSTDFCILKISKFIKKCIKIHKNLILFVFILQIHKIFRETCHPRRKSLCILYMGSGKSGYTTQYPITQSVTQCGKRGEGKRVMIVYIVISHLKHENNKLGTFQAVL